MFHKIIMYKRFKWCISDRRSVSNRLKARGYPCAKGYNSSASQWLSGEQVRLCSGHPKVHFGTIVEGSLGGGGGGGCTVGPPGSLTTISRQSTSSNVHCALLFNACSVWCDVVQYVDSESFLIEVPIVFNLWCRQSAMKMLRRGLQHVLLQLLDVAGVTALVVWGACGGLIISLWPLSFLPASELSLVVIVGLWSGHFGW